MIKKEIPVSIIMLTCEVDKAEPALRQLLKQEYSNKEIIIINDNPKVKKIPPSMLKLIKLHKIKLINNPKNIGIAGSYNKGIKAAKTNIIITTCDDYFPENKQWIRHVVEKFSSDKKILAVGSSFTFPIKAWRNYRFLTKLFIYHRILKIDPNAEYITLESFKKELFKKIGLFDSKNFKHGGEDGDLYTRIRKAGCKTAYIKDEVVHEHYNKNSNFLEVLKKEYIYGKAHGARKRKDGILPRIGLFDFEIRILFIIGFIVGLFINPIISLFCFLPFFLAALVKSIKAYPQTKWIPGLIFYPFAGILTFLIHTVAATKEYLKSKPDKHEKQ